MLFFQDCIKRPGLQPLQRMAQSWDSYFDDLSPLSSDPSTLATLGPEESHSKPIENFTGHDFSGSVAPNDASTTNLNFNPNFFSSSTIENLNSDCVYQRYDKETPWQTDGGQADKDYSPRCENVDMEFATDGLSTSSFPSSYVANLEGLKQDCGILTSPFLEDYSDVSSCSDPDDGETRPSCKFMASSSVSKLDADASVKHTPSESEWLSDQTGTMEFTTEYQCPSISNAANLPSSSNANVEEQVIESTQEKTGSPEYSVKLGQSQSSAASEMVKTSGSDTQQDRGKEESYKGDQPMKNIDVIPTQQEYSKILLSGHENVTGERTENETDYGVREKVIATTPNIITDFDKEENNIVQNEIESFVQDKNEFVDPESTVFKDNIVKEAQSDNNDLPDIDKKEMGSTDNTHFKKQHPTNLISSDCQNENMETNCQENENLSKTSQYSDPSIEVHDCQGGRDEFERSNTLSDQSSKSVVQDSICVSSYDPLSDENGQCVSNPSESFSESNSFNSNVNSCVEKGQTSAENVKKPSCSDLSFGVCDITGDSVHCNKNKQSIGTHFEPCHAIQPCNSSTDTGTLETETAIPPENKTIISPTLPDCRTPPMASDKKQQSACNSLEFCSQSDTSSTNMNPCLENQCQSSGQTANTTSPSYHQDVSVVPESDSLCRGHAENSRESFEELETSAEEPMMLDVLYGEPLSGEDSSCDTDESTLESNQYKDTSLARTASNSIKYLGGAAPQIISSEKIRKLLQPVVVLRMLKPSTATKNSFNCKICEYTTHNVDTLIEHNYSSHSVDEFQYCKSCNLYLMGNEQTENHFCSLIKPNPQLPSKSNPQKRRYRDHRTCMKCGISFPKLYKYIAHMRIHTGKTPYKCNECGLYFSQSGPLQRHKFIRGRCKKAKNHVSNSDANNNDKKTPPLKDLIQKKSPIKLQECDVKLVDIARTNLCSFCGKSFLTAEMTKQHIPTCHKRRNLTSSPSSAKASEGKSLKVVNKTKGKCKCPLCQRLFKYSYNRARHLRSCVRDLISGGKGKVSGKYRCPLCQATFTLSSNRNRHINTSCLREYINKLAKERIEARQVTDHKKSRETEKNPCLNETTQQNQSKDNEQLTQPQKKQMDPTPPLNKPIPRYKCSFCPAMFCHASGKYRHMKKHELSKHTGKFITYRNSVFSAMSRTATLSHGKSEESNPESDNNSNLSLSCHFCDKCFSTLQSLKKHEQKHKGEKPYHCLDCGRGFKRRSYMISHKIVHQKKIQCTICKRILPTIRELIQHRSSHLKSGMLQCPDCNLQFQYPVHLQRHLSSHNKRENKVTNLEEEPRAKSEETVESLKEDQSGQVELQCSLCKEVFSNAQVLRKHCLTHISGSLSNQCPFCKQNSSNRRCLLRHMIRHTGDKPFSCRNCGKQFYREIYLKLHRKHCLPTQSTNVTVETCIKPKGPLQCCYCARVFKKKMRLKNHLIAHQTNSLVQCLQCGQYFGLTKLNYHHKYCEGTKHPTDVSSLLSTLSKSTSQTSQNVKLDIKFSAAKMLQYKCPHCTQKFRFRSLLLRHLVSHTGVQPYACVHCGQRFRSQTMCLQHATFCDGVSKEKQPKAQSDAATPFLNKPQEAKETEFKCKFCTKTFMKARNLRRHILTHNEVNPYRCKTCDSCFSRYDHLKVHQVHCKGKRSRLEVCIPKISLDDVGRGWQIKYGNKTAEEQSTFVCEVCSRSFSTQSKLSRHNTMFHVTKLFKCTGCGSSFAHEKSLKNHQKIKRCGKASKEKNAFLPVGSNPTEDVTKPVDLVRDQVLRRIQPQFNKKFKYICSYCPRAFRNSHQLGVHIRLHTGERPYLCRHCGQRFIRKDYLKRHYQKCSKKSLKSKILCDRCGGYFPEVELDDHEKTCSSTSSPANPTVCQSQRPTTGSPPKGFSCAFCSSRFLLFSQLQEHFLNAHKLETMVPPVSTVPLQHHLSTISKVKDEPLDESCDKMLTDADFIHKIGNNLERENPSPFFCPECNMSFISKAGLKGHLRVHSKVTPFSCRTCKKGFWNKNFLRNHYRKCRFGHVPKRNSTQQMEVPVKAEIDFALDDSVLVFREGSKTTGTGVLQTSFSCKEDSADESHQNSDRNDDVQGSQSKEKKTVQYQCSECEKSFTDGLLLITHLEAHGREELDKKRNTCTKCQQVCKSQGHLERHMKTHGSDEEISCPNCPAVFYTLSDFEIHKTSHDLNRPFCCKLCNLRFWRRPSLCQHYREDHPDDVFTCHFCTKTYSSKKSLARHEKKWHQSEKRKFFMDLQEKRSTENYTCSQVDTTRDSDEDGNTNSADSDSDSAPYFPCHVCGKTFPTSESLEDHQLCHLGEKPHECAECGRCFFQASQLQQHQRMHKSEFQCQICGRGFVSLFALRKHKHSHGKSRPYRCSKCHLSFTGPLQLAEHMSTHQEENFPCDICNCVFRSKSSRAEHRKSHSKSGDHYPAFILKEEELSSVPKSLSGITRELKYRCGVCNERFSDPEKLSEHGCMAAKERPYSCLDCNKHFLDTCHLKKHRATHHKSQPGQEYSCNHCNRSFFSSQHFLTHLKSHIDTRVEIKTEVKDEEPLHSFICPVCMQCFVSATELICHFPVHLESIFECQICKMTFPSGDKLEEHERCHQTSGAQIKCTECHRSFSGSVAFRQHQCLHQRTKTKNKKLNLSSEISAPSCGAMGEEEEIDVEGEDLFFCSVCSMQFSSKSALLEHQNKEHQHEKPFKCKLCGKAFGLRRYLREHERRHGQKSAADGTSQSAEKKLECNQCHSEFNTAKDLSSHMRMHAEKEVGEYRCDMCYKSFSQLSLLKQHRESHVGQVVYECNECDKAFAFPHLLEEHQQTHVASS